MAIEDIQLVIFDCDGVLIDSEGIIRFARLSRYIVDRPDPKTLLNVLRKLPR